VDFILKYLPKKGCFLDVGCGTGIALNMISKKNKNVYGIEISQTSVKVCKSKKLNCQQYDGETIPFKDSFFDVVGSFNVLEHTDNPVSFLNENLRVLKNKGYLFVVCPNFLSTTNNYHYHTKGITRKIKNAKEIVIKSLWSFSSAFSKMKTINRKDFHPDDDAVNATNPIDILKWSKLQNLETKYWSSQQIYKESFINKFDFSYNRLFLGACFFIFKKK
jgi:SAM-dependent methyltransferase